MRAGIALIVEDADTCAATLEVAFAGIPGLEAVHVSSAAEALRVLGGGRLVLAVVTDLNMPRMDGIELIRNIRADSRHARTPIIVISGETDPHAPERAHEAGADAYFAKPFSPARVRQTLEQLLHANQ